MASKKTEEMKQRLLEERDALLRQRDALDYQIKGLERAIQLIADESPAQSEPGKRVQIKSVIFDLLDRVGTSGLDASRAVEMANADGLSIKRNSVSSLLSRLKADGAVVFDGSLYRLPKYVKKPEDDPFPLRMVLPRATGGQP